MNQKPSGVGLAGGIIGIIAAIALTIIFILFSALSSIFIFFLVCSILSLIIHIVFLSTGKLKIITGILGLFTSLIGGILVLVWKKD